MDLSVRSAHLAFSTLSKLTQGSTLGHSPPLIQRRGRWLECITIRVKMASLRCRAREKEVACKIPARGPRQRSAATRQLESPLLALFGLVLCPHGAPLKELPASSCDGWNNENREGLSHLRSFSPALGWDRKGRVSFLYQASEAWRSQRSNFKGRQASTGRTALHEKQRKPAEGCSWF